MSNKGTIVQVIGAVIDADFSKADKLPSIYNALEVSYELNGEMTKLVLEVQQHLGDGWVRTVAMSTSDGLTRGMELTDTGAPISVPVGAGDPPPGLGWCLRRGGRRVPRPWYLNRAPGATG